MTATAAPAQRGVGRWLRMAGAAMLLLLAGLLVLVLETSPLVTDGAPPGGAEVRAGRAAFARLRAGLFGEGTDELVLSPQDLRAVTRLAGRGLYLKRTDATVTPTQMQLAASVAMPAGLWLNLSATAQPAARGFPPLQLAAGDLVLSGAPARWVAETVRLGLGWRGVELPPLDDLVRRVAIADDGLHVQLANGLQHTRLVQNMLALGGGRVDDGRVEAMLCQLVTQQQRQPSGDLAIHLQRVMAAARPGSGDAMAADHRNALVALALFTAGGNARRLVADQTMFDRCPPPRRAVLLSGRPDLAKHWAVSAALAAVGGLETGRLLGEWKELADSMAGGSGFSFVDLAADRAGLRLGRAAVDPALAPALRAELAGVNNERLLPPAVLTLAEGLPNARFIARYQDTDSRRFAAAVRAIDRMLADGNTPGTALPARKDR